MPKPVFNLIRQFENNNYKGVFQNGYTNGDHKSPTRSVNISFPVQEACADLVLSSEDVKEVMRNIGEEIRKGLKKSTNGDACIKCYPTYVRELPNGKERGRFLALDLGGTNFRVLLIELKDKYAFSMESKIYAIPVQIMHGTGKALFDHIAECLATFMFDHDVQDQALPLGFTFSFPCAQEGLTKARLVTWTKGFKCSGVEGEDVVLLLQEAILRRKDVHIDVLATLNDTTGCLMSCAFKNPNCGVGVIFGTGTNACYMEDLEEVELWNDDRGEPKQVIINTEWGAFGDHGNMESIITEYDRDIDEHSINRGKQLYEKMISGMYMGEIARLVLVKLTKDNILFGGQGSDRLFQKNMFYTKYVSEIESDPENDFTNCRLVLEELGLNQATEEDCASVRYVCECVSRRAAHLASAGVASLLNKMAKPSVTVAVDGSVYRFHPHFHDLMMDKISELIKPGLQFDLMLSEDGSGRGAALVAAVATRINLDKHAAGR